MHKAFFVYMIDTVFGCDKCFLSTKEYWSTDKAKVMLMSENEANERVSELQQEHGLACFVGNMIVKEISVWQAIEEKLNEEA